MVGKSSHKQVGQMGVNFGEKISCGIILSRIIIFGYLIYDFFAIMLKGKKYQDIRV